MKLITALVKLQVNLTIEVPDELEWPNEFTDECPSDEVQDFLIDGVSQQLEHISISDLDTVGTNFYDAKMNLLFDIR